MIDQAAIRNHYSSLRPNVMAKQQLGQITARQTAFLCHSHQDVELAKSVQGFLQSYGWIVYIDWEDAQMPEKPSLTTANVIKSKISKLYWFLYLATSSSSASKWCPWEIGYADGVKDIDRILIMPTRDGYRTYGQEYLGLYRKVDFTNDNKLGVFDPSGSGVYISSLS